MGVLKQPPPSSPDVRDHELRACHRLAGEGSAGGQLVGLDRNPVQRRDVLVLDAVGGVHASGETEDAGAERVDEDHDPAGVYHEDGLVHQVEGRVEQRGMIEGLVGGRDARRLAKRRDRPGEAIAVPDGNGADQPQALLAQRLLGEQRHIEHGSAGGEHETDGMLVGQEGRAVGMAGAEDGEVGAHVEVEELVGPKPAARRGIRERDHPVGVRDHHGLHQGVQDYVERRSLGISIHERLAGP